MELTEIREALGPSQPQFRAKQIYTALYRAQGRRPGVADIQAGKIDCVVIYKVDRLSRSLFDFARIVSVTQQLNSGTPMGRLTLHVLLSFAQFEREIISEPTRDKKSAAQRKGKWTGGYAVLGYDAEHKRCFAETYRNLKLTRTNGAACRLCHQSEEEKAN
jgi:DNA invertase Pin-like site-specific DNA recombinase